MWILNEELRNAEISRESDTLFNITGMKPTDELTQIAMLDYKSQTDDERAEGAMFGVNLVNLIKQNTEHY